MELEDRLPQSLKCLVKRVAHHVSPGIEDVIDGQLTLARIARGGATMIDLDVPETAPRVALPDGPLPVRSIVHDPEGHAVGEILVWIRDGRLVALEQARFTADPPVGWPEVDDVTMTT